MTKGVKICIIAVCTVFVLSVILLLLRSQSTENSLVEIVQEGKTLYTIDISDIEYEEIMIESENGWNRIVIEDGKIFVQDADCKDKTCCRMGRLDAYHNPIVCLPHKLVIKYKE